MGGYSKMGWRGKNMACTGPHSSYPVCAYSTATSVVFFFFIYCLGCLVHLWCGSLKVASLWSNLQSDRVLPDWRALFFVLLSVNDYLISCCDLLVALVLGAWKPLLRSPWGKDHLWLCSTDLGLHLGTQVTQEPSIACKVHSRVSLCLINNWAHLSSFWNDEGNKVLLCICNESLLSHQDSSPL